MWEGSFNKWQNIVPNEGMRQLVSAVFIVSTLRKDWKVSARNNFSVYLNFRRKWDRFLRWTCSGWISGEIMTLQELSCWKDEQGRRDFWLDYLNSSTSSSCFLYVCESAFLKCCPWRTVPLQSTCRNWGTHEPPAEIFQEEQVRSGFMPWVFEKLQEDLFLCCSRFLGFLLSQSYPFQSHLSGVLECILSHLVPDILLWNCLSHFSKICTASGKVNRPFRGFFEEITT